MSADELQLWAIAAVLGVTALAIMLWPLIKRHSGENAPREDYDINVYKDQLLEIEADLERSLLSEEQGRAARLEIKRRMLAAADSAETVSEQGSGSNTVMIAILTICVPVGAVLLYLNLGSPKLPDQPLAGRDMRTIAAATEEDQKITRSAAKLAEYLQNNPDDLRGWTLLARTYLSLGRYPDSATAYGEAYRLDGANSGLAVDYGEALTLAAESQIPEMARTLFEKALAADYADPKARYYLGMYKAQHNDVRGAMQAWIDLAAMSPPEAPWLPILNQQIGRAANESGIDPATIAPSAEALALAKQIQQDNAKVQAEQADAPGPTNADVKAALGMSEGDRNQMIRTMVERLAGKMKENPNNKEGWIRLERAYRVLGEIEKADEAAARAAKLP
ncbi:MAG: c-type cytochrome biogenesis protein CcmI [Rhodospirillales bacterium]|nr:c-type cytochrome biogenesis protein CcmI [Rhodospirillales bacterium]